MPAWGPLGNKAGATRKIWVSDSGNDRVVVPGATSVRFVFRPPKRGQYLVQMRAYDKAGNGRKAPNVRFKVVRR